MYSSIFKTHPVTNIYIHNVYHFTTIAYSGENNIYQHHLVKQVDRSQQYIILVPIVFVTSFYVSKAVYQFSVSY